VPTRNGKLPKSLVTGSHALLKRNFHPDACIEGMEALSRVQKIPTRIRISIRAIADNERRNVRSSALKKLLFAAIILSKI
jgi:hypothetical protein